MERSLSRTAVSARLERRIYSNADHTSRVFSPRLVPPREAARCVFREQSVQLIAQAPILISLASQLAGKPNPETFPFQSMTLHLKPPLETAGVSLANGAQANGSSENAIQPEADGGVTLELDGDDMNEALQ